MKADIHPDYVDSTITCACGVAVETKSAKGDFSVDICAECHPFYTGKQRIADTAGRVERFRRRYGNQHATQMTALEAENAEESATKVDADSAEVQAEVQEAVEQASAAAAVSADAPDTELAPSEPVPGTGKPPASSPENPARDTEETDGPVPTTEPEV